MRRMKDSGGKWIGTIPEEWSVTRLKDQLKINNGKEIENDDGGVPVYGSGGVFKWTDKVLCDGPALLLGRKGTVDKPLLVKEPFWTVDTMFYSTAKNEACLDYLYFCSTCFDYKYFQTGSTLPSMTQTDLGGILLPWPSIYEQNAIASYLNRKCKIADKALMTLEDQISLLKRYRASVIHEAVTRGLNPNALTKPSGVNWIGNIPEDWDVTPLGYLGSFQNGISKDGDSFGEGHPFVSYGDVYSNRSLPATVKGLVKSNTDEQFRYSVKTGDVFFTRTSETASEIAFASTCFSTIEKATFAGFLIRFRPNGNRLNPRYGSYYFRNTGLRNYFVKEMMIVTRASLGQQLLKRLPVLIPSIDEQERIADYLDARTAAIDAVLDTKRKQLDILKRRRQSLIYEYVTGKRRVTEEA